jgi:hypothetical protein
VGHLTELTTIAAAATTTTTIQIPANSIVDAVTTRSVTVIPVAATYMIGPAASTNRYGTGISDAAGTLNIGVDASAYTNFYTAATALVITPNATPDAATGQVRVDIYYRTITAPTS